LQQEKLVPSSLFGKRRRHCVYSEKGASGRRFSRYLVHGAFKGVVDEESLPFAFMVHHTATS
jgi:hypothetical protein